MMYGWGGNGFGAGEWVVMIVGMVIFFAIVIFGIIVLVRYLGHNHDQPSTKGIDPEAILRERLARGEIEEDEFSRKLTVLRAHK